MATPNFEQIQSFNAVTGQLQQAAIDEFMGELYKGITYDELIAEAVRIAEKYSYLGCELGAQWYDLCSQLAGLDVEPADLPGVDVDALTRRATAAADGAGDTSTIIGQSFNSFLQNAIQDSIRTTGNANLWRDYERGTAGGRWARVPVGDTCAWCLMLASQGAWYVSEESALGKEAGHYHSDCNCVAVYHADPDSIAGYRQLQDYKQMYYAAENARVANASGRDPYDEELQMRVNRARAEHRAKYDAGETDIKWTKYNETLIVMRYRYGLK